MSETSNDIGPASHISLFERIKRTTEDGFEFWQSRELATVLQYNDYRNFEAVIERAKTSCLNSKHVVGDHFGDTTEMIDLVKGAQREISVTLLSRYACYLIIQNADPSKSIVAVGQTYFAIQTRRQELDDAQQVLEDERRVLLRKELSKHNVDLAAAAKQCGVVEPIDYAIFQNHGYMGLYGGLTAQDIHARMKLKKSQKILDHMNSSALAANLFKATQAEEKLRRDKPKGKDKANAIYRDVGRKVRQTIAELGGTMPEDHAAVDGIKQAEKRLSDANKKTDPPSPKS
jgi:DNA-damage-inducible protein D